MSDERTCGQCEFFVPKINPATGRRLRSYPGQCGYPVVWPVVPMCFERQANGDWVSRVHYPVASPVWRTTRATHCLCFAHKEQP